MFDISDNDNSIAPKLMGNIDVPEPNNVLS